MGGAADQTVRHPDAALQASQGRTTTRTSTTEASSQAGVRQHRRLRGQRVSVLQKRTTVECELASHVSYP